VMQWFGVAELAPAAVTGSVGFLLDASDHAGAQSGGNFIGGSINNYQTGVAIGTVYTTNFPTNTQITASVTKNLTAQFNIALAALPTTQRLTPTNVRSMPQLHGSVTLKDEFVATNTTSATGPFGELGWISSTGGSTGQIAGQTNHPGVLQRISPLSTNNALLQLSTSAMSNLPIAALNGALVWDSTFIFSVEQNTNLTVRAGFLPGV
jgi:hypothetical protein